MFLCGDRNESTSHKNHERCVHVIISRTRFHKNCYLLMFAVTLTIMQCLSGLHNCAQSSNMSNDIMTLSKQCVNDTFSFGVLCKDTFSSVC